MQGGSFKLQSLNMTKITAALIFQDTNQVQEQFDNSLKAKELLIDDNDECEPRGLPSGHHHLGED